MAALLSGEMRDTVELNPAGVYLLEKFFSRRERTALFRSWAGSASMWPKGGNEIWVRRSSTDMPTRGSHASICSSQGNADGAPDDPENATLTYGNVRRSAPFPQRAVLTSELIVCRPTTSVKLTPPTRSTHRRPET